MSLILATNTTNKKNKKKREEKNKGKSKAARSKWRPKIRVMTREHQWTDSDQQNPTFPPPIHRTYVSYPTRRLLPLPSPHKIYAVLYRTIIHSQSQPPIIIYKSPFTPHLTSPPSLPSLGVYMTLYPDENRNSNTPPPLPIRRYHINAPQHVQIGLSRSTGTSNTRTQEPNLSFRSANLVLVWLGIMVR